MCPNLGGAFEPEVSNLYFLKWYEIFYVEALSLLYVSKLLEICHVNVSRQVIEKVLTFVIVSRSTNYAFV